MKDNFIKKNIVIKAPVTQVWQALVDYQKFSKWVGADFNKPFIVGQTSEAKISLPEYENVKFEIRIQKIKPQECFSYTWHPYSIDPNLDYSKEEPTLVEFKLYPKSKETLLEVIESGFEKIPTYRRQKAFQMNEEGWEIQVKNIKKYVENENYLTEQKPAN